MPSLRTRALRRQARRYVPPELRLVELCGCVPPRHASAAWLSRCAARALTRARLPSPAAPPSRSYTLGGVYLARYDDSPAGAFDEVGSAGASRCRRGRLTHVAPSQLVVLAGLVWNPPGSCAWAARVYVSNGDAQRHGVKARRSRYCLHRNRAPDGLICLFVLRFSQEVGLPSHTAAFEEQPGGSGGSWWRPGGGGGVVRVRGPGGAHVCTLSLPRAPAAPAPRLTLRLPSFCGATAAQPALLRYSLALRANVRPVAPAAVAAPQQRQAHPQHALEAVLRGRPLLTLAFDAMEMDVGQPQRVATAVAAAGTAKKAGLARA